MTNLTDQEKKFLEIATYHQTHLPMKWENNEIKALCDLVYQDLVNNKLNEINKNKDTFLRYWLSYFLFSTSENYKRAHYEEKQYLYKNGIISTGYVILTLDHLYLVMFKKFTELFPLYDVGVKGFFDDVIYRMAGQVNNINPLKEDRIIRLEMSSIKEVENGQDLKGYYDGIWIYTRNNQYFIKNYFKGNLQEMEVAIKMVHSGRLAKELNLIDSKNSTGEEIKHFENHFENLKQLNLMLQQGLISNAEYELKKNEILKRM